MPTEWRHKRTKAQLLLEEKHDVLRNRLLGNMKRKRVLELEITRQCEQLKKMEISMEKNSHVRPPEKMGTRSKNGETMKRETQVKRGKDSKEADWSAVTVRAQIHSHSESIEKTGYCLECRQLKGTHESLKTDRWPDRSVLK